MNDLMLPITSSCEGDFEHIAGWLIQTPQDSCDDSLYDEFMHMFLHIIGDLMH